MSMTFCPCFSIVYSNIYISINRTWELSYTQIISSIVHTAISDFFGVFSRRSIIAMGSLETIAVYIYHLSIFLPDSRLIFKK